jgi:hypothetical protein
MWLILPTSVACFLDFYLSNIGEIEVCGYEFLG